MDYKEGKYEEIKDIDQKKDGWRNLGQWGWGYAEDDSELIKQIAKEDGWRVFKVVDASANRDKTNNWHRDYYFISDKYKVFVPVQQELWDKDSFQNHLEQAIGKQKRFIVTIEMTEKATGKLKNVFRESIWAKDADQAIEKINGKDFMEWSFIVNTFPKDKFSFKIVSVKLAKN